MFRQSFSDPFAASVTRRANRLGEPSSDNQENAVHADAPAIRPLAAHGSRALPVLPLV